MVCKHERVVLLADGWFCPDCGEHFSEKPKAEKPKEPKKAEPKKANKSTTKK